MFVAIMCFWMRMYVHFFAQYIWVNILLVKVTKFDITWYEI